MIWNLSSRVHKLNHFPCEGVSCYVKREDELSCGISGSKLRKYASLVPYWIQKDIKHLVIIAGPQSNNLLAALQIAGEFQFKVTVFLLKPKSQEVQGNFRLSLLFLNEQDIIWIERDEWSEVERKAQDYLNSLQEPAFLLNEGASVPEALLGSMTLATDIVFNENQLGWSFDHIFVDAGTGFTAAGLIQGLTQLNHPSRVHVLLLADDEAIFQKKIQHWLGTIPNNYDCFRPSTAKSFGSVNQTIKNEIKKLAQEEGILADSIYSAKLFYESRLYITKHHLQGKVLIIHSGGTLLGMR